MKTGAKPGRHLAVQTLHNLARGCLTEEETFAAAEHLAECPACAGAFAEIAGERPFPAPAGFEEEISRRAARKKAKRAELFRYTFRVAAAACAAVFLIVIGGLESAAGRRIPFGGVKAPSFSAVDGISDHLRDFSQKILDMEGFRHAETEK